MPDFQLVNGVPVPLSQEEIDQREQDRAAFQAEKLEESRAAIRAQLAANDLKVIRAITEGDTKRIDAHRAAQASLRSLLAGG